MDAAVTCDGKGRHAKADAKAKAVSLNRRQRQHVGAYRCPHCGYWHVGHLPGPLAEERFARFGRKARR